jgi:hypothetical protein
MSASVNYRVARLPRLILIVAPFSPSLSRYRGRIPQPLRFCAQLFEQAKRVELAVIGRVGHNVNVPFSFSASQVGKPAKFAYISSMAIQEIRNSIKSGIIRDNEGYDIIVNGQKRTLRDLKDVAYDAALVLKTTSRVETK